MAYIEFTPRFDKKDTLTLAAELKEGKSEVVCESGRLIKISKDKLGVVTCDVLTKQ